MSRRIILLFCLAAAAGAQDIEPGRKLFAARCAACHGLDGAGGERGPGIVEGRRSRSRTRQGLQDVIVKGIPEAGMPAFAMPPAELEATLAFVTSLTTPAADLTLPGSTQAGESFFFGQGQCLTCHMVGGRGGSVGPDLSNVGRQRRLGQIEQALRDGGRKLPGYHSATVKLRDGRSLRGLIKNESNFDLQLREGNGTFHLLARNQIVEVVREPNSVMPKLQATADQRRDLLAYLSRLTGVAVSSPVAERRGEGGIPFREIATPKPGEWPTYHGHLSGNRHSPLAQINTTNVARLGARWIFQTPGGGRQLQVTPVVAGGVMFLTIGNDAYALDARNGREIWHYARQQSRGLTGDASSGIKRGVAVLGDKVFMVTDNAHIIALDRTSGNLLWETEMADSKQNYGATSAPLVVKDLVISGTSGGDEGARGFLDAYRVSTGERAWRFWTVPARGEAKSETWQGSAIEHGCGTTWLTGTYDPEADLLYWPTGNPCPDYNGDERKGDNLYTSSVIALEPATGKLRWHYQYTPHDLHDWDAAQTPMLINATFKGQPRKLLAQANRNGFFYVLDRLSGKLLLAEPFVKKLTWASGIGADGRPKLVPGTDPTPEGNKACPAVEGAANWMSTAYNPATGFFYVTALEKCDIYTKSPQVWEAGRSFYGGGTRNVPGEIPQKFLRALDIQTGKIAWEYPQIGSANSWGGVLSTAGGLVFFGEDSGAFAAMDAKTGKALWHFNTNQTWKASPMTYMVDGRQFVSIAAGGTILAFGL